MWIFTGSRGPYLAVTPTDAHALGPTADAAVSALTDKLGAVPQQYALYLQAKSVQEMFP